MWIWGGPPVVLPRAGSLRGLPAGAYEAARGWGQKNAARVCEGPSIEGLFPAAARTIVYGFEGHSSIRFG